MTISKKNNQSGQILILMSLFITTLIILFGMVVSIGHLVQSKINLQNAVDLAAMSGASWQARHLNGLAEVNFRMRQNHRYFMLDTYVTQARFNKAWRRQVASGAEYVSDDPSMVFAICQQAYGYQPVAAIGEPGAGIGESDMCRNVEGNGVFKKIPPIVPSPFPSLNPFYIAINLALIKLADRFNEVCTESAAQNAAWITHATNQFYARQRFQVAQMERVGENFSDAFGFIPPQEPIAPGPVADGTILSTFINNLIGSNRDGGPLIFHLNNHDARATSGGIRNGYMVEATTPVTVTYIEFKSGGGCSVEPKVFSANDIIPVGMSMRDTHGANDIQAFHTILGGVSEASILFWPNGYRPTLAAVGAAKPFGSRVGPPRNYYENEVTNVGGTPMANMSFYPGDTAANASGFPGMGHINLLRSAYSRLPVPGRGEHYSSRPTGKDSFWELAYAPTVFDSVFMNAYVDVAGPNVFRPPLRGRSLAGTLLSDASYIQGDQRGGVGAPESGAQPRHDTIPSNVSLSSGSTALYQPGLTASSWAPPGESPLNGGVGRHGYQIKLVGLQQACLEMQVSGRPPPTLLRNICESMRIQH